MQAVPSLVGTGTAVAAAAAGLVFGQSTETTTTATATTPSRTPSVKRKLNPDCDSILRRRPSSSRPGTSSAANTSPVETLKHAASYSSSLQPAPSTSTNSTHRSRANTTQITPPKLNSRRQSFMRNNELAATSIPENPRQSVSSNGSWIRRLSIRPLSQHGSFRSSVGPDSPSVFSHNSGAPILSPTGSLPPQLPPNKLVKRATSGYPRNSGNSARRGSRTQMPTLRRPATSHQRSATLQQFQLQPDLPETQAGAKYSLDQHIPSQDVVRESPSQSRIGNREPGVWSSFFHTRIARFTGRGSPGRFSDPNPNSTSGHAGKRIVANQGGGGGAYLLNPAMICSKMGTSTPGRQPGHGGHVDQSPQGEEGSPGPTSPEGTPSKRPRRSISMHFSSPNGWISRQGSLRRPKRSSDAKDMSGAGKRHASAPVPGQDLKPENLTPHDGLSNYGERQPDAADATVPAQPMHRQRNSSSPLPPLSRLSSFSIDMARLGLPNTASSAQRPTPIQNNTLLSSQMFSNASHHRCASNDRSFTIVSTEYDGRGFGSGDDDDTDFKSETMFDSLRTVASARVRAVETPIESMFDESPPSTSGNSRTKRLSIQEMLGRPWDDDDKIMEEEECVSTPVRAMRYNDIDSESESIDSSMDDTLGFVASSAGVHRSQAEFARLSLDDDDEDEDWAKDEDNGVTTNLSPPSSINSRGVSPTLRTALAAISGNSLTELHRGDAHSERPRSNIFDWSEPAAPEKTDNEGHSPRPKTAHTKQEMDVRGGRTANRKGPSAAHVRSQSVPVVPEPSETTKPAQKFGTWGLGNKTASEDWDDDFDFGEALAGGHEGKQAAKSFTMVVPASIQATQPNVRAHSGQIRELSLLVNDLKRLCRHGRDLDLMAGPSGSLWQEAEGIIALASPDEEDEDDVTLDSLSLDFDPSITEERFLDEGFDGGALDTKYDPFMSQEPEMSKTAVIKERHAARRRSVFSPEDDIFGGNWPLNDENMHPEPPRTPERMRNHVMDATVAACVKEAMQQHRVVTDPSKLPTQAGRPLNFDTNSLQELVKQASSLRDTLSDIIRRTERITQSPANTPRRDRHDRLDRRKDGSPAFTRVFTEPSSPPKHLPKSHSTSSVLSGPSIDSPKNSRMQMMTVS